MKVIPSYSYTCRCSNCALNHLQNAVDCLCCKEIQKSVESLEALLSRAKPRTWHNNRMWNNAPGIQYYLPKTDGHTDQKQQNTM